MSTCTGSNGGVRPTTRPNSVGFMSTGGSNIVGSSSHMFRNDPFPSFAFTLGNGVECGGFSLSVKLRKILKGGVCGTAHRALRSMAGNSGFLTDYLSC